MNCVVCFNDPCGCKFGSNKDVIGREKLKTLRTITKEIDFGVNVGPKEIEKHFRKLSEKLHKEGHDLANEIQVKEATKKLRRSAQDDRHLPTNHFI